LRERRSARQPAAATFVQQLVGLDAKMKQYEAGERFIEAVEAVGGPTLLARVWEGPEMLPTLLEIREPQAWIRRVSDIAPDLAVAK
jgi:uncharacterized protein (DUF2342 family)